MIVIDKHTNKQLNVAEILSEVNRDHSAEWEDYNEEDLRETPEEVLYWLDPQYYEVKLCSI